MSNLNNKLLELSSRNDHKEQDQKTEKDKHFNSLMPPPPARRRSQEWLSPTLPGVMGRNFQVYSPARSVESVSNLWNDRNELSTLPALLRLKRELKDNVSGDGVGNKRQRLSNYDLMSMNVDVNKSAAAAARTEQRMKERRDAINDIVFSSGKNGV